MSFHPRNKHNFEQAAVLAELFPKSFEHVTSVYFGPWLIKWLKRIAPKYSNQLGKRSYYKLSKKYVRTLPSTEVKIMATAKKTWACALTWLYGS